MALQVRDYPPPCRHTKASTEKDLIIKSLEAQIREYEKQVRLAEEEAEEYREEIELEKLKSEHQEAVIKFQEGTIKELEDVLAQQQALVDAIFADPKSGGTAAMQAGVAQQMDSTTNRIRQALNRQGRTDGQAAQATGQGTQQGARQQQQRASQRPTKPRTDAQPRTDAGEDDEDSYFGGWLG